MKDILGKRFNHSGNILCFVDNNAEIKTLLCSDIFVEQNWEMYI